LLLSLELIGYLPAARCVQIVGVALDDVERHAARAAQIAIDLDAAADPGLPWQISESQTTKFCVLLVRS